MANKRASGQALLGFWADPELAQRVDKARGHASRSQFLRDALAEKLTSLGIDVPRDIVVAPDRAGKGGQPTHKHNRKGRGDARNPDGPFSFPVADSVGNEEPGRNREDSIVKSPAARPGSGKAIPVGSDYQAPTATVPIQKLEVPAEVLPGHSPSAREAILDAIPVAMRISRERKATDDKRSAYAKVKADKKAAEDADRQRRAADWHAKQAVKPKAK